MLVIPLEGHRCRIAKCDQIFDTVLERDHHEKEVAHFRLGFNFLV